MANIKLAPRSAALSEPNVMYCNSLVVLVSVENNQFEEFQKVIKYCTGIC